jgi:polysaccharide pyruvyl transferase WcaK-like protein
MLVKSMKIAVLHHLGGGNLGDEASFKSVIQNILARLPEAKVHAFTMNPDDTSARYGIPAFPIRRYTWSHGYCAAPIHKPKDRFRSRLALACFRPVRIVKAFALEVAFLFRSFCKVREYDQLVVSGGGQLTGRDGPWSFPYGLFIWLSLARLARVRRVFLNIGAGPLATGLASFFSIGALDAADYVSFRDSRSAAVVRQQGYKGLGQVVGDNVYLLHLPRPVTSLAKKARPIVGVAPIPFPFCNPQEVLSGSQQIYDNYIDKFAQFTLQLTESSHTVELFGLDFGVDTRAVEDLRILLRRQYNLYLSPNREDRTVNELLARYAALEYVVTCRFHGVVFAHILNKPVLAVAHHPKVITAMADLGLSEYCFNIADFRVDQLSNAFFSMVRNRAEIKRTMKVKLAEYRAHLDAQYDELFLPSRREFATRLQEEENAVALS